MITKGNIARSIIPLAKPSKPSLRLTELDIPTTSIIKGDLLSISISAASVIAKVERDHMLYEIDKLFPMYDLKNNKGYGTKKHIEAIKQHGVTPIHRLSFLSKIIVFIKPMCYTIMKNFLR